MKLLFLLLFFSFFSIAENLREKLFVDGKIEQCFFTPDDNITDLLVELIKEEKLSIKVAMYYLSDHKIINALIDAKKRNVLVEIIIDNICVTKINMTNLHKIVSNNIDLGIFNIKATKGPNPIMHNKYFIFDKNIEEKTIFTSGSFNCTYSAQARNKENLIVTESKHMISKFKKNFAKLKEQVKDLIKKKRYIRWLKKIQSKI